MQKRVFIIHGWDGHPEDSCFPWLKAELEKRGFAVFILEMPDPQHPSIDTWVTFLKEQVGAPDDKTVLFGHSIGAQTILRYLESFNHSEKIKGAVFLAGWVTLTEQALETAGDLLIANPWLETPINWKEVKSHCDKFIAIFSDDDPLVPISDVNIFKSKLNANIIIEHGEGHFNEVKELLPALMSILEVAGEKI